MKNNPFHQTACAALVGLLLLAVVMFAAMLAGIPPHPPGERGPYLGAVAALAIMSLMLLRADARAGVWLALLTALAFIPSVGLHKFWTEAAAQALAPLILVGSACVAAAVFASVRMLRH